MIIITKVHLLILNIPASKWELRQKLTSKMASVRFPFREQWWVPWFLSVLQTRYKFLLCLPSGRVLLEENSSTTRDGAVGGPRSPSLAAARKTWGAALRRGASAAVTAARSRPWRPPTKARTPRWCDASRRLSGWGTASPNRKLPPQKPFNNYFSWIFNSF